MTAHLPVMCQEIVQLFSNQRGPLHFVDATFGRGGHTQALLQGISGARVTAIDRDPDAIAYGHSLIPVYGHPLRMVQSRFSDLPELLQGEHLAGV